MINDVPVSRDIGPALMSMLPECFQFRAQVFTPEELFYCLKLLKFQAAIRADGTRAITQNNIHYLALQVRLKRFLLGKERSLFSHQDWACLRRMWEERFYKFCLGQTEGKL